MLLAIKIDLYCEELNINNDLGVFSIPQKLWALKTTRSLFIHYITANLLRDTLIFYQCFNEIDVYLKKFTFVISIA